MKSVSSFDVFDTCLIRKTAEPTDVFYDVARKTLSKNAMPTGRATVEDFVAGRIQAEFLARQQSSREDVSLAEIWQLLLKKLGWQFNETMVRYELEAEAATLSPVSTILNLVRTARQKGYRIIFVSDMYLPGEFIQRQLEKHGFAEEGDGIYVSGDVGKTKSTGNLFRYICEKEHVSPSDIRHIGDNENSDFRVPRNLGIRVKLFKDSRLTHPETCLLETNKDVFAASRMAGAMRAFRLGSDSTDQKGINELASQFVAPFVLGFATWVLQRAQESGVQRLYFVSRDCQLVWKAARELAPQFGGIDCRYLYVSRQALFLPSTTAISPDGMPWMRRSFEEPILKNLLAKIDLKFEDVQSVMGELACDQKEFYCLKSEKDWQKFWTALNDNRVKGRIDELIRIRRETAQKYFQVSGLYDECSFAIVDFGWYLTGQQSLWKVLQAQGWQKRIRGFYLALKCERISSGHAGDSESLFYQIPQTTPIASRGSILYKNQTLLEHIVGCADHPSVHHYQKHSDGTTGPAFTMTMDAATLRFCEELHGSVIEFVSGNPTLIDDFRDARFGREILESLATSFFHHPTRESTSALGGLSIATDQNGLDVQSIVKPLDLHSALFPLLPKRGPLACFSKRRNCYWEEGSIAMSTPRIQKLLKIARRIASLRARVT